VQIDSWGQLLDLDAPCLNILAVDRRPQSGKVGAAVVSGILAVLLSVCVHNITELQLCLLPNSGQSTAQRIQNPKDHSCSGCIYRNKSFTFYLYTPLPIPTWLSTCIALPLPTSPELHVYYYYSTTARLQ